MSNPFKDRLKRLHDAHQRGRDTENGPDGVYTAEDDENTPADGADSEPSGYGWERLGAVETADYGAPLWVARRRCAPTASVGRWTIDDCRDVPHRGLGAFDDAVPDDVERRDVLYMDTETTGLGENAIVFMLGVGYWETDDSFVVEQFLLHDEDDEPALIRAFFDRLANHRLLVTFNGKSFDVPVLERRCEAHGLTSSFGDGHHLDLLPLARRSFPGLDNYKLATLEREVLDFERVDDVPGREIPRRWWKFQKSLNPDVVRQVLEHNRHDVVSMEALISAAMADEAPRARKSSSESKWSFSRLGFHQVTPNKETPAPKKPASQTPDAPSTDQPRSRSKIAQRLERTYRLRGKFAERGGTADESADAPSTAETDTADASDTPTHDAPPTDDTPYVDPDMAPQTGRAAHGRVDEIKSATRRLIDQNMWREAFPMLCELVALIPHDEWGLQMLAKYYRREGEEELAKVFEERIGVR